ncbi:MAG: hypothetical protein Q9190_000320 [Brigantiaea leucoxantha]
MTQRTRSWNVLLSNCDPFTAQAESCLLGDDAVYAINVTSAEDVAAGVRFAQKANIRLVIKSTGSDLLGRSTGEGTLSIWTHYLKGMRFLPYNSPTYSGPAVKVGAVVQGWEILKATSSHGLRIVAPTCPTVAVAGGFTQGGGHSDLSSINHLIASPNEKSSLFWALSGGGAGTYGVVLSMTIKAFLDGPVGSATLSFNALNISDDAYWSAITAFHSGLLTWAGRGGSASYTITNTIFFLQLTKFPGLSVSDMNALIQPLRDELQHLNVTYSASVTSFPSYLAHFAYDFGPLPYGIYTAA